MANKKKSNKCSAGWEMGKDGTCHRTKVSKAAEKVARVMAGVLTGGGSEAIIRGYKKRKHKKILATKPKKLKIRRV